MAANQRGPSGRREDAPTASLGSPKVRDLHGTATADTIPPTPLKDLLSAGGANVYVLSVDPTLIETVQRAGGEQYPVFTVGRWSELETAVSSGRCGIALLDATLLDSDLTSAIEALQLYADRLVTLVAAERSTAQELVGALSDRRIHRLLIKPPAIGITRLLLESAVTRCLQLRDELTMGVHERPTSPPRPPRRRSLAIAATGLVAVTMAAGAWLLLRPRAEVGAGATAAVPPPAETAPAPADADTAMRSAGLLSLAERATSQGRLAAPPGDNALDYYLVLLRDDPEHGVARARLDELVQTLFARAEAALLEERFDDAETTLDAVRRSGLESGRLAFLDAQLARARAAGVAARPSAEPAPAAARPVSNAGPSETELASLLTIGAARIKSGELLTPAGDSAREYLNRAARLDPTSARVREFRGTLIAALLAQARTEIADANVDEAARWLAAAAEIGASPEALQSLEEQIVPLRRARQQQLYADELGRAESLLRAGAVLQPERDNALTLLTSLQRDAPGFAGLDAAWATLRTAVASDARAAIGRGDLATAEQRIGVLERVPDGSSDAAALRDDVAAVRLQTEYLATATPAGELSLARAPAVEYPATAVRREIEGWVDLEYVVDREGRTRDVRVVDANPTGVFEEAALAAVTQYEYQPFVRDGRVYERLAKLRVRFNFQ
jgi:protein TonB